MSTEKESFEPGDPGYWAWRGRTGFKGKPKAFKNPDHLWKIACDYFHRVDSTPFMKQEQRKGPIKIDKDTVFDPEFMETIRNPVVELKTIKPYTWSGLCDYLNEKGYISTLQDYQQNRDGRYEEYVGVIRVINETMFNQKFMGAAVGAFNANIISRDLGLIDKSQQTVVTEQPLFSDDAGDQPD